MFLTDSSSAVSLQWPLTGQIQTQRWKKTSTFVPLAKKPLTVCPFFFLSLFMVPSGVGQDKKRSGWMVVWTDGSVGEAR